MYAIIKTGGKQYKAEVGEAIYVEKLDADEGKQVTFDEVIMVAGEGDAKIGSSKEGSPSTIHEGRY